MPNAAIDSNGNAIFVWSGEISGIGHVFFSRFDINGNALTADTLVDQSWGTYGVVASLPGGGFVVAYDGGSDPGGSIHLRIFSSSGVPVGDEFRVDQNS